MEHIKKILLRVTALVLVAVLTVGLVPTASAAPADAEAELDELDYSLEGKTPLGSMIAGALSEETGELTDTFTGYNVTGLRIEGNTAAVTYDAMEDARLVVALYTEDGLQLLNSAHADVTADENRAEVTFEGEMPQYFTAEAYLLDSYDYSPLCTPYESVTHTQDIQELIASDIHDYDAELVLNLDDREDTNFAVYHETTIRIEEREGVNLVTTLDYENDLFVIENADEQFTSLAEGDVISYFYDGGSMLLARVAGIETDGTTVTIRGGELELSEVFSHMKLESGAAPEEAYQQQVVRNGDDAFEGSDTVTVPVEVPIKKKKFCNDKVELSMNVVGNLEAELDYYITTKRQSVEFTLGFDVGISFEAKVESDPDRFKVPLGLIPIPLIPGVVDAAVSPNVVLELEASISGTGSINVYAGVKIDHKGIFHAPKVKDLSCKPKVECSIKVEGTIFLGVELQPKVLLISGAAVIALGAKGGAEIVGTFAEVKLGDGIHHDCDGLCITGQGSVLLAVTINARILTIRVTENLVERRFRIKQMDFYMCAKHGDTGLGECPHMLRKITVTVKDENGDPVKGAAVSSPKADTLLEDGNTNKKGVVVLYLPEGKHEITVAKDGLTARKSVKVKDDPKKVTIKLKPKATEEEEDGLGGSGGDHVEEEDVVAHGQCGDHLNWKLETDGTLYILGQGSMYNYTTPETNFPEWSPADLDYPEWSDYKDRIRKIVIGEGVDHIGAGAFWYCYNLTEVTIPGTVRTIGPVAFDDCEGLTRLTICEGVTSIGEGAFWNCRSLEHLAIPASVVFISDFAFGELRSLQGFNVDEENPNFCTDKAGMLYDRSMTKLVQAPAGFIGSYTIPDGVSIIGTAAFMWCTKLTGVTIPSSVQVIGDHAFRYCQNLSNVIIGEGVSVIGEYAFSDCSKLSKIALPTTVDTIYDCAFSYCSQLSNITIPAGVTEIADQTFIHCGKLSVVTIPVSVTEIGEQAFYGCSALSHVYYGGTYDQWCDIVVYSWNDELTRATIHYTGEENGIKPLEPEQRGNGDAGGVGLDAVYSGSYGSDEYGRSTADFDGLVPGAEYVLLVLASLEDGDRLAADNLLYISHAAAAVNGTASFTYIPRSFADRTYVFLCGPSSRDLKDAVITFPEMAADGELQAVEPTVVYGGVTLTEGEDYELIGDVSYQEAGTYTCYVQGIHDYTGMVECAYTVMDHVHEFGEYTADGNATCTADGTKTAACIHCGLTDTVPDEGSTLGHSFGEWAEAGNGMEERSCTRCGYAEQRPASEPVNPFTDVPEDSFYYEAVMWAVENGITNGTTPTTFGPNDRCMRAHVVTFLWRAAGSPEPSSTENPFVDVKGSDFYYKAVLWAMENGVTNGVDATHFGPFAYCNRAQVVTFLYRSLGSPAVEAANNPFTDVPQGQWFTAPVLWAVENGVTNGLSATAFGPDAICNRAQIVTFLYRAFA